MIEKTLMASHHSRGQKSGLKKAIWTQFNTSVVWSGLLKGSYALGYTYLLHFSVHIIRANMLKKNKHIVLVGKQ